ncbi:hypothetical protein DFJ73DRAFT_757460 [Zopfochytrium polystomum]|nr:hypothetical protein DFJ73DRAFT_757460 [Zopfochytrium polystomum]
MDRLWKPKAFVNVVLDSSVVTATTPLSGSVCIEVIASTHAPEGVVLNLAGVCAMSWTEDDADIATSTVAAASSAVSAAASLVRSTATGIGILSPADPPSYEQFDRVTSRQGKRATAKREFWTHTLTVAPAQSLEPGTYSFNFSFAPPRDLTPPFSFTSAELVSCEVKYTVSATLTQSPAPRSIRSPSVAFSPQPPPLDLRADPPLESTRTSGFLFGRQGETVAITLRSPRAVYAAGDDAGYFLCHARNNSAHDMNELQLQLVQRVVLSAAAAGKKSVRTVLHRVAFPGVAPGAAGQKVLKVELPSCPPTVNIPGISISYEVHLIATMGFSLSEVRAHAPIAIVGGGHGLILSDAVQREEEELSRSRLQTASATETEPGAAAVVRVEPPPRRELAVREAEELANGARPLPLDVWQAGAVSYGGFELFYHDVSADVVMATRSPLMSRTADDDGDGDVHAGHIHGDGDDRTGVVGAASQRSSPGVPGVVLVADADVGLRISKDVVPTWWTYDLREESRSQELDGTQESCARLALGPGRYYIAVYGSTLTRTTGYRVTVTPIRGLQALWDENSGGGNDGEPTAHRSWTEADVLGTWVTTRGSAIPPDAWAAGYDLDGDPLYIARAWIGRGLHLGKVGPRFKTAVVPYNGVEKDVVGEYEVLCGVPAAGGVRWVQQLGKGVPPNAVPGGNEEDGRLLYIGRATVHAPGVWPLNRIGGKKSVCPGKRCTCRPFEVLVYEGVNPTMTRAPRALGPRSDTASVRSGSPGRGGGGGGVGESLFDVDALPDPPPSARVGLGRTHGASSDE